MDFAIKPVSETLFQDNYPFYTIADRFTADNRAGHNENLNVGAVQPLSDALNSEDVPEIGKGANIDIYT